LFKRIIITAIYALELLINSILKKAKTEADKVADTVTEAKPERKDYREIFKVKSSKETVKEAVPEMLVKSVLASKFHRLTDIISWRNRMKLFMRGRNSLAVWRKNL